MSIFFVFPIYKFDCYIDTVVVPDKKQLAFLEKYYKILAKKRVQNEDEDVNLQAFKGGGINQSAKEQQESDGFFSKVGSKYFVIHTNKPLY